MDHPLSPLLEIFLVTAPGLETALAEEVRTLGFSSPRPETGGVTVSGDWPAIWRANLMLRGAIRVLVRVGSFRAPHLAQLDKRARRIDWGSVLRGDVPVRVEAACRRSRIYHNGAAAQRVATAIADATGCTISDEAPIRVLARIEDDLATLSLDTTGEPLHKRGIKTAVNAAPMRETIAAALLRMAGFDGAMAVLDPMCGSGTFVIEAAEMAMGLAPGRARGFAFEHLASFDARAFTSLHRRLSGPSRSPEAHFFGSDRDVEAIRISAENAARAGVAAITRFARVPVSELACPDTAPGLVMVNPPYGTRLGRNSDLVPLYAALGRTLRERFSGWRVGLVTSDPKLARATRLSLETPFGSIDNGGLRITLYVAGPLG